MKHALKTNCKFEIIRKFRNISLNVLITNWSFHIWLTNSFFTTWATDKLISFTCPFIRVRFDSIHHTSWILDMKFYLHWIWKNRWIAFCKSTMVTDVLSTFTRIPFLTSIEEFMQVKVRLMTFVTFGKFSWITVKIFKDQSTVGF